jgi:hypothetical protein
MPFSDVRLCLIRRISSDGDALEFVQSQLKEVVQGVLFILFFRPDYGFLYKV